MPSFKTRLARLETIAKRLDSSVGLVMPNGSVVNVQIRERFSYGRELICAHLEHRKPSVPFLDLVLSAAGETGGGSFVSMIQSVHRSLEMYPCEEEPRGAKSL